MESDKMDKLACVIVAETLSDYPVPADKLAGLVGRIGAALMKAVQDERNRADTALAALKAFEETT